MTDPTIYRVPFGWIKGVADARAAAFSQVVAQQALAVLVWSEAEQACISRPCRHPAAKVEV